MDTKGVSFVGGSSDERNTFSESPQGLGDNAEGSVLSDLLIDVPRLTSEEPKAILKFFVDLKAIYELNLVPNNVFLLRLLPKVQGGLLTFFGECIRHGDSWEQCKVRVLKEYFPLFVREKMIRELAVFHFQERGSPLRELIEVVDAAEFLQYCASEGEIVDRILMNLHLDIFAQAAFLPRPGLYSVLRDKVGLIEERMVVLAERQRSDMASSSSQMVEKGCLLDSNKLGRAAVEDKPSSKNGPQIIEGVCGRLVTEGCGPA
jgi:hypothetical protein